MQLYLRRDLHHTSEVTSVRREKEVKRGKSSGECIEKKLEPVAAAQRISAPSEQRDIEAQVLHDCRTSGS